MGIELLRKRIVVVGNVFYECPMFIQRLNPKNETGGWQLRYKKPWKSFSDNLGGTQKAFDLAVAALAALMSESPKIKTKECISKNIKTGKVGVTVSSHHKKDRPFREWYARAHHPTKKTKKNFYIGTEETATDQRATLAINKAIVQREKWEDELFN